MNIQEARILKKIGTRLESIKNQANIACEQMEDKINRRFEYNNVKLMGIISSLEARLYDVEMANNVHRVDRMEKEVNSLLPLTDIVHHIDSRLKQLEFLDLKNRTEISDTYIENLKVRMVAEDENNAVL